MWSCTARLCRPLWYQKPIFSIGFLLRAVAPTWTHSGYFTSGASVCTVHPPHQLLETFQWKSDHSCLVCVPRECWKVTVYEIGLNDTHQVQIMHISRVFFRTLDYTKWYECFVFQGFSQTVQYVYKNQSKSGWKNLAVCSSMFLSYCRQTYLQYYRKCSL